ncbi:MAG: hypothetical protein CMF40_04925 [Legionellales bacterium]|nr:hypothetical protein [Legionellales bacterium]|tara:strand:+ start:173 stop:730 length:558 start_codon:yes stop_codon:yes gene_type:complete
MDKIELLKQKNWISLFLLSEKELLQQCIIGNFLSSKPGGQHRDKKASSVRISLFDGDIAVTSSRSRSLQANQKDALNKLKIGIVCKYRSDFSLKRCIALFQLEKYFNDKLLVRNSKINLSSNNPNYLIVAGIILDILFMHSWQIQSTSKKLGVSSSHLVNFFSKEKKLLIFINAEREKLGMRSLK